MIPADPGPGDGSMVVGGGAADLEPPGDSGAATVGPAQGVAHGQGQAVDEGPVRQDPLLVRP